MKEKHGSPKTSLFYIKIQPIELINKAYVDKEIIISSNKEEVVCVETSGEISLEIQSLLNDQLIIDPSPFDVPMNILSKQIALSNIRIST
ncbi:hypothetical protein C2S51_008298 [Perilla frutescens var. frutescens]|nr:hypothetical protein C2S51_008298 [Perilla frutescens var. frutescens]